MGQFFGQTVQMRTGPRAFAGGAGTADVMTIQVSVRDPMNRFVTGLDKANFRLFEDGLEQEVTLVRTGHAPVSLGLGVIGISDKMGTEHTQIEAAFRQFFRQFSSMNPMWPTYVILPGRGMDSQPGLAFDIIDRGMSIRLMQKAPNSRKVMLVFADSVSGEPTVGRDSSDGGQPARQVVEEQSVIAEYAKENVLVYALDIVGDNESPSRFLTDLTTETGGHLFTANVDNVAATAMQIGAELQNLYGLEYTPRNTAHGGAHRTVKVELITPRGLPALTLEYRPGYYEPLR
jgi:hypothetical protein